MDRHVIAHGNHPRLAIENGTGIVAPFLDVRRKRGAPQGRTHLLGNGMHRALKDCQLDRIGCAKAHAPLLDRMTRFPKPSTRARQSWRHSGRRGVFGDHGRPANCVSRDQALPFVYGERRNLPAK